MAHVLFRRRGDIKMATLKERTQEKHDLAERIPFNKQLIEGTLPQKLWDQLLIQKYFIYGVIESRLANSKEYSLPESLKTSVKILSDAANGTQGMQLDMIPETAEYVDHLSEIPEEQLLAHVYVHLMGDLYGGQILRQKLPYENKSHLLFEDRQSDIKWVRDAIAGKDDNLAVEANRGFDAILKIQNAIFDAA